MAGAKQSTTRSNCVFVASCGACDPAAHVMVCNATRSVKSRIVYISNFPLHEPFRAPRHTLSITMVMFSMQGWVPVRSGVVPLCDNPVMKYTSETSISSS